MKIGILAIQGDYDAHAKVLERLGVSYVLVKKPSDMEGICGLILPGGESTTHLKVLKEEGLYSSIEKFAHDGGAFFGTCAGTILLADKVKNPEQESLGLLNALVARNAYGRQLSSHVDWGKSSLRDEPIEMVFIRAPIIESTGKGVTVLAENAGHPVLVQQERILAATFHPELTNDTAIHEHFLTMCKNGSSSSGPGNSEAPASSPAKR